MNNLIRNQIYPIISHDTSLWLDSKIQSLNVTKAKVAAIIGHEKRTDMRNS